MGGERGQASPEYVAVIVVVALALGGLGVVTAGSVTALPAAILGAICRSLDARCGEPEAQVALEPCPVHRRATDEGLTATVMSVEAARGDSAVLERLSDGSASITFADRNGIGLTGGAGASFSLAQGGGAARAEGSITPSFNTGRGYEFESARDARAFLERYGGEEGLAGEARRLALRTCLLCAGAGLRRPELPQPDVTYLEGGGFADGRAGVEAGPGSASATARVGTAIGRRIDHRSGERTSYHRLEGAVAGSARAVLLGAHARGEFEAMIEHTTAADGTPLNLTLRSARLADAAASLRAPGMGDSRGARRRGPGRVLIEHAARIDLRDPENRRAAHVLLEALGPTLDPAAVPEAVAAVAERIEADGAKDVRSYRLRSREDSATVEGMLGFKVGAELTGGRATMSLEGAYSQPAGAELQMQRTDCLRG